MKCRTLTAEALILSAAFGLAACFITACTSGDGRPTPSASDSSPRLTPPTRAEAVPRDYPGLHNVVAFHEGFYSGGVPEGDAAFDSLAALGVKTIISVDGAETDVDRATSRGMTYIHLPIGYHGFEEARKLQLVRATRDAMDSGSVYIHCHHGKHRSAGAAAAVAVSLGWMTNQQAYARMKVSGTADSYPGLYACAASAGMLSAAVIDAVPADFPSRDLPKGMVRGMIDIDTAMDHLKAIERARWQAPEDHPDLAPASEAGKLADLLRYLETDRVTRSKPAGFVALLRESSGRAATLETMLVEGKSDPLVLSSQFKLVADSCKDCHARYRD